MKIQKVDDGPLLLVLAPIVDVNMLPGMKHKLSYDVERDCRWYHVVIDNDDCLPSDVLAEVVEECDDILGKVGVLEADGGYFFTATCRSDFSTALARLPKTVSISSSKFADLALVLIVDVGTAGATSNNAERRIGRWKGPVSFTEMADSTSLNAVSSIRERVAAADAGEDQLCSASAATGQIARATADLS